MTILKQSQELINQRMIDMADRADRQLQAMQKNHEQQLVHIEQRYQKEMEALYNQHVAYCQGTSQKIAVLKYELEDALTVLDSTDKDYISQSQLTKWQEKLNTVQDTIQAQAIQINDLTTANDLLQEQLVKLQKENGELFNLAEKQKGEKLKLEQQNQLLMTANGGLTTANDLLQKTTQSQAEQITELAKVNNSLEQTMTDLQGKFKTFQMLLSNYQQVLEGLEDLKTNLPSKLDYLNEKLTSLQETV